LALTAGVSPEEEPSQMRRVVVESLTGSISSDIFA
jgi:hypothetical protein